MCMNCTNMTKTFVENNEKSDFNGFKGGKVNYDQCVAGIFNFVMVLFLQLSQSRGLSFKFHVVIMSAKGITNKVPMLQFEVLSVLTKK